MYGQKQPSDCINLGKPWKPTQLFGFGLFVLRILLGLWTIVLLYLPLLYCYIWVRISRTTANKTTPVLRQTQKRRPIQPSRNLLPKPPQIRNPRRQHPHNKHSRGNNNVPHALRKKGRHLPNHLRPLLPPLHRPSRPPCSKFLHLQLRCRPRTSSHSLRNRPLPTSQVPRSIPAKLLRFPKLDEGVAWAVLLTHSLHEAGEEKVVPWEGRYFVRIRRWILCLSTDSAAGGPYIWDRRSFDGVSCY